MLKLIKSEWQLLLFGFLMTFWSSPGQTFLISLFSGELRADLGLSDGEFAAVYSMATLLSAIAMIWSGALADRVDLKKLSLAIVFGLGLGCGMMSISDGIVSLLISLFLLRQLGQGLMFIVSSTAMVRYLDEHKGKASALASMGYAVAEAVMPSMLVALLLWVGWRQSWQIAGILLILFMVPAILYLLRGHRQRHDSYLSQMQQSSTDEVQVHRRRQWTRSEVIRDRYFYLFAPGLMSQPLMFTGFIFHQVHLVESKGWPLIGWAALFSLYAVVSVATKLVSGVLIDRYGAIRMVPLVALPMGIGLIVLAYSDSLAGAAVFLALTGITVGYQSTTTAPFWSEMYGNRHLGAIKSLGAAAMVFCTALSPIVIGWQIDIGTSMETLAIAAAVYIFLTSALAYYAYRSRAGFAERQNLF
ncbi:MAG: MFS transporter [Gammaproteobacteria bacterium]|nr:MFS transporter [Gammaproteobacteria bacterium]